MSTMTFIGRTTREAMALAKARFGSEVEIVDSRQTDDGVELTAIVQGVPLQRRHLQPQVAPQVAPQARARRVSPEPQRSGADPSLGTPREQAERPMSTVSFESYVRDRQERQPNPAHFPQPRAVPQTAPATQKSPAPQSRSASAASNVSARLAMPGTAAPTDSAGRDRLNAESQSVLLEEMRSMKQFMAGQLETVRWFDTARRRPSQMRLLRILLARQFSTVLAKSLCDLLPMDFSDKQADRWLRQTIVRTLASFAPHSATGSPGTAGLDGKAVPSLFDRGGVFALTGPTGVGKTTTVAKIAAQYAMRHGAGQVALISADVYRIGALEQLRSFGQLLGVPVHVAHDRSALKDLLGLFSDRKLVLIDTAGVSQRDPRVEQLLAALDLDPIQRIVVFNAAMQAATLQEVARAYRAGDCAGVLLSKTDEAVQLGGALDCLIRNRLHLLGFANGQRVPEDFYPADLEVLVDCAVALQDAAGVDGDLEDSEVRFMLESAHV